MALATSSLARFWALLCGGVAIVLMLVASQASAQQSEDSVKAIFLYRFASYVNWPAASFPNPQSPIVICVMGAGDFSASLNAAVRDQHAADRAFAVRTIDDTRQIAACHILYLADSEDNVREALRASRTLPVLTVSDADATPDMRGIVHFVVIDDRVRFHIDDARAAEAGLTISSRLLSLAVSVRRRSS